MVERAHLVERGPDLTKDQEHDLRELIGGFTEGDGNFDAMLLRLDQSEKNAHPLLA